ncbi:MAG: sugar nucleotide-binding protein [Candidatus Magasanikbacteria bacterium]|jgi:dTDP-4-dehydrorhamnose reductase|nr:sugar nucleotide-binding protein [Candidatus Magasanikbacteria bacterium]
MKILLLGAKGFVGRRCANAWDGVIACEDRITSSEQVEDLIAQHNPDVVLNAAGVRGKPNVDWCEDNQIETMVGNTVLPILVAKACAKTQTYLLHIGSGCIFYGDSSHEDKTWREEDFANPSVIYSRSKYAADLVLSTLPQVGIARIRMPIDWVPSPNNMIDKLTSFSKVIDVENSVTVVEDMLAVFYELLEKKATGVFHVTNPGLLKHRDIIQLYQKFVNPDHTNEWITDEDLVKKGLSLKGRSNNVLSSKNLEAYGIEMRDVHIAMEDTMKKYSAALTSGRIS